MDILHQAGGVAENGGVEPLQRVVEPCAALIEGHQEGIVDMPGTEGYGRDWIAVNIEGGDDLKHVRIELIVVHRV